MTRIKKKTTRTKSYFECTLSVNIFLLILFTLSTVYGNGKISTMKTIPKDMIETQTIDALSNNSIQHLGDYSKGVANFNADLVVNMLKNKPLNSLTYDSVDGSVYKFNDLINVDGSVTGLVLNLKDSSKASLLKDIMDNMYDMYRNEDPQSDECIAITTYRDYLANQLGMTIDEAKTLVKYSGGVLYFKDNSSLAFEFIIALVAFSTCLVGFILINIVGSLIGLHLCKKDEKGEKVENIEECDNDSDSKQAIEDTDKLGNIDEPVMKDIEEEPEDVVCESSEKSE